jgi:hypothetical protein
VTFKYKDGREVEIDETHFELGEGCYIVGAHFTDTGAACTDDEIAWIEDAYAAELYQDAYEDRAAAAYDHYKDRMKYGGL